MPQFMIEKDFRIGDSVEILGNDAHHIKEVLRLKAGSWIVISNGKGARYRCKLLEVGKKAVLAEVESKLPELKLSNLILAQALTKHDKLEFIIQKAVELGVAKIIPYTTERTIPKFSSDSSKKKADRWNKIAGEAAKQCGMSLKPVVEPIMSFEQMLQSSQTIQNKILFYEGEKTTTLEKYFLDDGSSTIIAIGPEGGFTDQEVKLAIESGFTAIGIGPLIMRVETAAIAAITLTQHSLGYFS